MGAAFSLLNAQSEGQAVGGGDQSDSVAQGEFVRGRKQGGHWCSASGTHGEEGQAVGRVKQAIGRGAQ